MNHELLVLFDRIDCSLVSVEGIQKIFPFLFGEKSNYYSTNLGRIWCVQKLVSFTKIHYWKHLIGD